jgi:hypothetical protein
MDNEIDKKNSSSIFQIIYRTTIKIKITLFFKYILSKTKYFIETILD